MDFNAAFSKLHENCQQELEEAIRIFSKIVDNILKDPNNVKMRTLQKNNSIIRSKIIQIRGGLQCLKLMGFEEDNTTFLLPISASLKHLEEFRNELIAWKNSNFAPRYNSPDKKNSPGDKPAASEDMKVDNMEEPIERIVLPPLVSTFSNLFLKNVEARAHSVLQYENKKLQERAKKLIPLPELEVNAQGRLRAIQEHIKANKLPDPDFSIQDTLILELLKWFKEDFFEWVDSPTCAHCSGDTTFSHMSTDRNLLVYTDRVELHRCKSCHQFTPFPRYNDLNILLETRRGRCGEWANTFTLFCRSMGWDSRYVIDEGDHVWTEVYSITQKRWLHCDPCENICDTPLVYESGWNKKISYVIAYSGEEVQDVTWRYSSHHKEVLQRRKNCAESELIQGLIKIREKLQKNLSENRKKYLTKRSLLELVEFLTEKKPDDKAQQGRISGSELWKLARGEIQESHNETPYLWDISDAIVGNPVKLRYSTSSDKYELISSNKVIKEIKNWNGGTFESKGIFKKEEKDWKMVYLTRKEGEKVGSISWKLKLNNSEWILDTANIYFDYRTFENGEVAVKICSEDSCVMLSPGEKTISTRNLKGAKELTITASLSGGKGDVAWQHAQLFRQSLDSGEFPFSATLSFIKKNV